MPQEPIASVFNDAYAAEQFEAYRHDPTLVEESWRQFFRFAEAAVSPRADGDGSNAQTVANVSRYISAPVRTGTSPYSSTRWGRHRRGRRN